MSNAIMKDAVATEGCAAVTGYVGELPTIPDEFKGLTEYCLDCIPSNRELEPRWRWCPKCRAMWKRKTPHTAEVSDGGPLTPEPTETRNRRSLH